MNKSLQSIRDLTSSSSIGSATGPSSYIDADPEAFEPYEPKNFGKEKMGICARGCQAIKRTLTSPSFWFRIFTLAVLGGLAYALYSFFEHVKAAFASALLWIGGVDPRLGSILLSLTIIIQSLLFLPCLPFTLGAGFLYGWAAGSAVVQAASTLAALAGFLVARYFARGCLERKFGGKDSYWRTLDLAIRDDGFWLIFLIRFSPLHPFGLCNYFFGLTTVSLRSHLLATFLATIPTTMVEVYFGTAIKSITEIMNGDKNTSEGSEENAQSQVFFYAGLAITLIVTVYVTLHLKNKLNARLNSYSVLSQEDVELNDLRVPDGNHYSHEDEDLDDEMENKQLDAMQSQLTSGPNRLNNIHIGSNYGMGRMDNKLPKLGPRDGLPDGLPDVTHRSVSGSATGSRARGYSLDGFDRLEDFNPAEDIDFRHEDTVFGVTGMSSLSTMMNKNTKNNYRLSIKEHAMFHNGDNGGVGNTSSIDGISGLPPLSGSPLSTTLNTSKKHDDSMSHLHLPSLSSMSHKTASTNLGFGLNLTLGQDKGVPQVRRNISRGNSHVTHEGSLDSSYDLNDTLDGSQMQSRGLLSAGSRSGLNNITYISASGTRSFGAVDVPQSISAPSLGIGSRISGATPAPRHNMYDQVVPLPIIPSSHLSGFQAYCNAATPESASGEKEKEMGVSGTRPFNALSSVEDVQNHKQFRSESPQLLKSSQEMTNPHPFSTFSHSATVQSQTEGQVEISAPFGQTYTRTPVTISALTTQQPSPQ